MTFAHEPGALDRARAAQVRAARIALDRELVRRGGFYTFVKLAWQYVPLNTNTPFIDGPHIEQICLHAEATIPGSRFNPDVNAPPAIQKLAVNIPPGYSKSMLLSILLNAWVWTFRPEFRFQAATYSDKLKKENAIQCRDLVRSQWYRDRWGEILHPKKSNNAGWYFTKAGGFRFSTTIGGQATGTHGHIYVVDDPVKPPKEDAMIAGDLTKEIENANSWLKSVMASRTVTPMTYSQIMVMQRLAEFDPTAQFLRDQKTEPRTVQLSLSAFYDPDMPCVTPIGGDWRAVKGEMLEPTRFPQAVEEQRARNMGGLEGPIASAQLQQSPAPPGGLIFKKQTFHTFKVTEFPIGKTFSVLSVDCNFKKSPINSDVGITVEGIDNQNRIFVYFWESSTFGWTETRSRLLELIKIWRPTAILIEDKANGSAMIDELKNTYQLGNVIGPAPDTTKESRAHAANVSYQAGMVYHNADCLGAGNLGGVADFEGALAKFPRGMKKDVIDAHSMAVLYLAMQGGNTALAAFEKMGELQGAFAKHFRLG